MKRRNGEIEFDPAQFRLRARVVAGVIAAFALALVARSVQLQVLDREFLAAQADIRHVRTAVIPANRGAILDRNGEPIAVSSPVDSVVVNPPELAQSTDGIQRLAKALKRDREWLAQRVTSSLDRQFLYVARHMDPAAAAKIMSLGIPGVRLQREYRRYYPNAEVTGHLLGFTNLDDAGQEGLELAYDRSLAGINGQKRVIQDGRGRIVQDVESIRAPRPGEDLYTSIDLRVQYLAYRELKAAVQKHRARAGTVIALDVTTGEVLAMVNQPAFNPNDRRQYEVARYRNRAATDIYEPGSSIKPFIIAAALASGRYGPDSTVDARPFQVGGRILRDKREFGTLTIPEALAVSSNVALAKIALSLDRRQMHDALAALGFGELSASGFPGESAGLLAPSVHWRDSNVATMAFGYGLSVTPLQLAQGYATIGALGVHRPLTFRRVEQAVPGDRVLPERLARELVAMLEGVVTQHGTGYKANVPGYRVAGKTGTAWKAIPGGYSHERKLATFGGVVPASRPRIAVLVLIDEPGAGEYYGGDVAAPVFSAVASGALRLMSVAPDEIPREEPVTYAGMLP